jgi:DNA-binding transcriptional MocR family regulator
MTTRAVTGGWVAEIDRAQGPLYLAIAKAIGGAIGRGDLLPGERLPPHRALAAELGVDLTTVTRAYTEAQRRGWLEARTGSGTFVRADAAPPTGPGGTAGPASVVDMSMNLPPQPQGVDLRALMREGVARLLRHEDVATLMAYRNGAGTAQDRAAGAAWLAPVLGPVNLARLLVCPGAQSGMLAILSTLARPGDVIATEPMTYPGIRALAAHLGLVLAAVETDEEGFVPAALDRLCQTRTPRAIYCCPTMHNPTAVTTSLRRREKVAEIARRHGIAVIEDDAYGLIASAPLPSIATFAPDHTFHVATTAKTLSPGLRTAYLAVPPGSHAVRVMSALRASVMMASPLLISLVTEWIREGAAAEILAGIRAEAAARQRLARAFLPADLAYAHPEGLHVWLTLPSHWEAADFVAYVRHHGLALVASDAFHVPGGDPLPMPNAVRVSLGVAANQDRLREALRALADALRQRMPAMFADVV